MQLPHCRLNSRIHPSQNIISSKNKMAFETYLREATGNGPDRTLPGAVVVAADRNGKFLFND
jgi:hypothetical protein